MAFAAAVEERLKREVKNGMRKMRERIITNEKLIRRVTDRKASVIISRVKEQEKKEREKRVDQKHQHSLPNAVCLPPYSSHCIGLGEAFPCADYHKH